MCAHLKIVATHKAYVKSALQPDLEGELECALYSLSSRYLTT